MKLSICQKFISELISSTVLQLPIFVANLIANYDDGNTTFETTISEVLPIAWLAPLRFKASETLLGIETCIHCQYHTAWMKAPEIQSL